MKALLYRIAIVLAAVLMLGACSNGSSLSEVLPPPPPPNGDPADPADPPPPEPTPISAITADNALLLARSTLDMIGKLIVIGDITTTVVHQGASLLTNPQRQPRDPVNLPECNDTIEPGPGTNQITFEVYDPGFFIPAGEALSAAFSSCTILGLLIDGTLTVAALSHSGDLASPSADWSLSATVVLGPVIVSNPDDSRTSYTDKFRYTATRQNGILTVDVAVAADPDAGQAGGLNAQHHLTSAMDNLYAINYQFRPFRITTVDNPGSGEYRVIIQSHAEDGVSRIERYTTRPPSEIQLTALTEPLAPLVWPDGRPLLQTDKPASGEVVLAESAGSIRAVVGSEGVELIINDGAAVTTRSIDWAELLSPPDS